MGVVNERKNIEQYSAELYSKDYHNTTSRNKDMHI